MSKDKKPRTGHGGKRSLHGGKRSWHAGKPKKKPDYNSDAVTEELVQAVVDCYLTTDENNQHPSSHPARHPSLSQIVEALPDYHLNPMKVRRILITANSRTVSHTEASGAAGQPIYKGTAKCEKRIKQISTLRSQGHSISEIAEQLSISPDTVLSYSPYSKIIYKMNTLPNGERSVGADRQDVYRKRKLAVEKLKAEPNGENLWAAVVAFEHYPFTTTSDLPFTYTFKLNRHGQPGNELQISRKSKTITRSSIEMALAAVVKLEAEMGCGFPVQMSFPVKMSTPKELGVFGASYIYPLFIRFGLVEHIGSNQRGGPRKGSKRKKE